MFTIASEQLKSDVMSSDEYIEHVNRTAVAAQKLSALEAIQEKYSFIKKLSKYDAELTYDIEFTDIVESSARIGLLLYV